MPYRSDSRRPRVNTIRKNLHYTKEEFQKNLALDAPFIQIVKRYVPVGGNILDAGCGPARTAISLAYTGFSVTEMDRDERMLDVARKKLKNRKRRISKC